MAFHAGRADGAAEAGGTARAAMLALALAAALAAATGADRAHAATLQVKVADGLMSAELGAVPVADVLASVAEQTGAHLETRGDLGNARPQAFAGVPLTEGLSRVVQPNGMILEFAPTSGRNGDRRLIKIRVVAPGTPAAQPSGGSAAVTSPNPQDPRRSLPPGFWDYAKDDEALPEETSRIQTITMIARTRGAQAANVLTYVLRNDPELSVRQAALRLLTPMQSDEARTAMTEAVADAEPQLRMDALRALISGGRPKPVPLLAQTAKGDADPGVRAAALALLSRQDGDLARAVLEGARTDADAQVREAAEQALHR